MWGTRSLSVMCALAALAVGALRLEGQVLETVNVNIVNQNFEPAEIRVVDEVCEKVAFEGQVLPNSTVTVSLCPDRAQRGQMTIYDAAGRAQRYRGVLPANVYLRMR